MKSLPSESVLIPLAFAIIYIVWGSTYLVNWYAIQDIPPLFMSGSRFFAAGAILYFLSTLFGQSKTTLEHWKNASVSGIMFLAIGTGGMVWAAQFIASSMLALMVAFQPLLILLLVWQMNGKKPSVGGIFGTALGMVGMTFLVAQDQFFSDGKTLLGLGIVFVSLLSWGIASVRVSKIAMPGSKLQSAGMQMLSGGAALLLAGLLAGEAAQLNLSAITLRGAWSWVYLVVFGSIVAFSAFNYLLVKSTPDKVATSNYVNPVVAMLLGWGLNNENITGQSLLAAVLLLTGVVFINSRKNLLEKLRPARPHPVASLVPELAEGEREVDIQIGKPLPGTIARIWHGKTLTEKAAEYLEWTKAHCVKDCVATPGNLGVTVLHRTEGDVTRHFFISYWKDVEAVKRYAGEDYHKPRLYAEETSLLLETVGAVEHKRL